MVTLKSIELHGFKSFADRTKLLFSPGITSIIGPNGCGKSNVVDSFRWCLGEQSANSLRSKQMLDVIFNGSQSRSPTNLCEVMLTFDNTDKMIPIDYAEITIARKLFRSGESEYYLNKVQCRLKDIKDLLLDTGIGTEGYSLFEQGRVEFITNAKPEERRELFEEAAGVSKYKSRREETFRKLEKVTQDMNRVNDIIGIIKDQISALESAVRKAKLYQKYQEELRTFEISDIVKKLVNIEEQVMPEKKLLDEFNNEFVKLTAGYDTVDAELSSFRVKFTELEQKFLQEQQQVNQFDNEIVRAESSIDNSKKMSVEFNNRKKNLIDDISRINGLIRALAETSSDLNNQYSKLQLELNTLTSVLEEKNSLHAKVYNELDEKQNIAVEINNRITEFNNKRNEYTQKIEKLNSELLDLQTNSSILTRDLSKLKEEKNVSEGEREQAVQRFNALKQQIESDKSEYDAVNETHLKNMMDLENIKSEYTKLKEKYISILSKIDTIQEIEKTDPLSKTINAVLGSKLPGIQGTVSDIIEISSQYERNVVEAFGDKLNYIICDTTQDALNAIQYLKTNNIGVATFIVNEQIDEQANNDIMKYPNAEPIISAIKYDEKYGKIVKFLVSGVYFSNDIVYQKGIISGGSYSEQQLFNPRVELNIHEEEVGVLKQQIEQDEVKIKELENRANDTDSSKEQKSKIIQELEFNFNLLVKTISEKEEGIKKITGNIEQYTDELTKNNAGREKIQEQIIQVNNESLGFDGNEQELKHQLDETNKLISELREQELRISPELMDLKSQFATFQERINAYSRELEKLNQDIAGYEKSVENHQNEINSLESRIAEQDNIFTNETRRIDELYKQKSEFEKQVNATNLDRNNVYNQMVVREKELQELKHKLDTVKEKVHEKEMSCNTKELERRNLDNRLTEFGVEFDSVKETHLKIDFEPEEIPKLKRRIESMGSINQAAPEEYASLEQRYNWLLTQQQDLIKADEDLRQAIYKINARIKDSFSETFVKVRENFKQLFSQLFEGGEADLILTDENNLLESGIDVIAMPPGKKLQSITLLSGGEKALTAIALLFSFYLVKPSPICILDEVDAPLDESNVVRYINMVKTFSERSQFVVITHNKRTMEMADSIYGVTMEEFGISKILSLKFVNKSDNTQEIPEKSAEVEAENIEKIH